jgi:hypothetical protein
MRDLIALVGIDAADVVDSKVDVAAQHHYRYRNNVSMKTTIDLPDVLYRRLKVRAAESGVTIRELVVHGTDKRAEPGRRAGATFICRRKGLARSQASGGSADGGQ